MFWGRRAMTRERRPAWESRWAASCTLAEHAQRMVLSWNGRMSGCFDLTRAAMPARWGAANELPVVVMRPCSSHGTSTSMPGARNSVGGSGLWWKRKGSFDMFEATLATEANSDGNVTRFTLLAAVVM